MPPKKGAKASAIVKSKDEEEVKEPASKRQKRDNEAPL